MAITKEFLTLFNEFVTTYKRNGTPSYLSWSKEQNHEKLSVSFEELKDIIERNKDSFNDASIINHMNKTVLSSIKTNPYLVECWHDFLKKYDLAIKATFSLENNLIKILPEDAMLSEFQAALNSNINAMTLTQKAHTSEIEKLRKQVQELTETNKQLQGQIEQQQLKIRSQEHLLSMLPRLEEAPRRLVELQELLMELREEIKPHDQIKEPEQKAHASSETIRSGRPLPAPPVPTPPKAPDPVQVSLSTNVEISPKTAPTAQKKSNTAPPAPPAPVSTDTSTRQEPEKIAGPKAPPPPPPVQGPSAGAAPKVSNLQDAINAKLALWKQEKAEREERGEAADDQLNKKKNI